MPMTLVQTYKNSNKKDWGGSQVLGKVGFCEGTMTAVLNLMEQP